jgi:hypothetical protein
MSDPRQFVLRERVARYPKGCPAFSFLEQARYNIATGQKQNNF